VGATPDESEVQPPASTTTATTNPATATRMRPR
jgi:hypothetical protein